MKYSEKVKELCYDILDYYGVNYNRDSDGDDVWDRIGSCDIDSYIDFLKCDKYRVLKLSQIKLRDVYACIRQYAIVISGYLYEENPDGICSYMEDRDD